MQIGTNDVEIVRADVRDTLATILVATREPDRSGLSSVGLGYLGALGGRVPLLPLDVQDAQQTQQIVELARFCSAVIVTESPAPYPRLVQQLREVEGRIKRVLILPWDSNELPEAEVEIFRSCFDLIVPISEVLGREWARQVKDVEFRYLPIPLELRAAFAAAACRQRIPSRVQPIEVLSIGAFHTRKNHRQTVRVVEALRDRGWNLRLRIHSSLDQGEFASLRSFAKQRLGKAARITNGPMPLRDLHALYADADVFVTLSQGEGYNIPLREALATGLPALVSAIPGHADVIGLSGVVDVPCDIAVPARYPERDHRVHGVQHVAEDCVVIERFELLLERLTSGMFDPPTEIAHGVRQFDIRVVRDRLWDEFADRGVLRLASTYRPKRPSSRRGRPLSTLVVPANDAGFFSLFNTYVSHVAYWERANLFGRVVADWSADGLVRAYPAEKYTSFCYAGPADANAFYKLFQGNLEAHGLQTDTDLWSLPDRHVIVESYNVGCDPYLTYKHAEKLYRSLNFAAWRRRMHAVVQSHMQLAPELAGELDGVIGTLPADVPVLGMHVRHPSHAMEQRDKVMADVSDYVRVAAGWLSSDGVAGVGLVILATDQQSVVNEFRAEFGDRVVVRDDVQRVSDEATKKEKELSAEEKLTEGRQIQHLLASDRSNWTYRNAAEVVVDAWSLARSDVFVHTNSNVATAVAMVNPKSTMLHIRPDDSWDRLVTRHHLSSLLPIT